MLVDRIDFGDFGNSKPFRIRVTNLFNDNSDYFYVKQADASRIYGLELEHILSPNRINYMVKGNTLIEEHIAGVPGDIFSERWLENKEIKPIRIANELSDTKKWHSHGQMISHEAAGKIGLTVNYLAPHDDLWQLYWRLFCLQLTAASGPIKLFEGSYASLALP